MPSLTRTPLARAAAALCLCGLALATAAAPADELGTLLYTPAQRDQIVRERRGETAGGELQEITLKRLNGVVRRERGRGTVWLNGEALPEGAQATPPIVGVDAVVKKRRLRVGQSVDTVSGEASDLVPPGAVRSSTVEKRK